MQKQFRKFLTKPEYADSYVRVQMDSTEILFKLTDCDDTVHCWFNHYNKKRTKISLKKLAVIQEHIDMVKKKLLSELETQ